MNTITIKSYLDHLSTGELREFKRLRKIVYEISPDATEGISYSMPVFRVGKHPLISVTIKFTTDKPLSDATMKKIVGAELQRINKLRK